MVKAECLCGCGQPTEPAPQTITRLGIIKSKPKAYLRGHRRKINPVTSFWQKVHPFGDCWVWQGHKNKAGYGNHTLGGVTIYAHRFSYTLLRGPIPSNLELDHLCRNTTCCNPDHLEPVTRQENCHRGAMVKLNSKMVAEIRSRYNAGGWNTRSLGKEYGVAATTISSIVRNKTWRVPTG